MGIADTIKGWFSSGKSSATAHSGDLSNTMKTGAGDAKDKMAPQMDKMNDGIDTTARKMDDMTGGKAGGAIDKGADAAKDAADKLGKQNP